MQKTEQVGVVGVAGQVTVRVFGPDGKLKQSVTKKNLVVTAGLTQLANRIANVVPATTGLVNYFGVGTGTNAPSAGDTTLQTENARKQVSSRANVDNIASISVVFGAGEVPTSTLKEVGMFIDATATPDSGTLFARQNIDIGVTALDSVFIDWRLTFSAS